MSMQMLIGGELVESANGGRMEAIDPATEQVIGSVPAGTAQDMEKAVAAAESAQPAWAALSIDARAAYMHKVADGMDARAAEILEIEVKDTGNTIAKMEADVQKAAERIRNYAALGFEVKGITVPSTPGNLHVTVCEPYGVVGRIIPFNHPIAFAGRALAGPLITGNTVVIKPPEQSSLSAGILGEICKECLPAGVVNIVTGEGAAVGDALVRHPRVKRIAFTGSAETGMIIQRAAAEVAVKHVTLELGGKNPMIVFPDADLDKAIPAAVAGMNFAWQGQSCGSTSRLFVHDSLYDRVLEGVAERVRALRIGMPLDYDSQVGPMNNKEQLEKAVKYIALGVEEGARLVVGGKRPEGDMFAKGYWIEPAVFADVTMDMRIAKEEIFGPVMSVIRWSGVDEVIEMANATDYGLTAAIWTRDIDTAITTARRVQSGYVWINGTSRHYRGMPFGGMKNSGTGREESIDELLSYTETKAIHVLTA
ncbi:MAG: aldehyde dehydrogenase family protein [Rhodospirillales bacterium]|nr:aldehyde dehydrogenase family protein [Rhodospirillales bacterium]